MRVKREEGIFFFVVGLGLASAHNIKRESV